MAEEKYLPELLDDLHAQLAAKRISRDEAVSRITDRYDITRLGAEDLLDNGIRIEIS